MSVYYGVKVPDPHIDYRPFGLRTYKFDNDQVIVGNFFVALRSTSEGVVNFDAEDFMKTHPHFFNSVKRKLHRAGIPAARPIVYFQISQGAKNVDDEF